MITCENLVKIYKQEDLEVVALQGLDLQVDEGEFMAIIGSSGSGKSTLLNMLGALDTPSAGKLFVDGKNLLTMTPSQIKMYKRETVGFVWQNKARNLIPYLTALENVELPMLIKGRRKKERARELLEAVGLGHRIHNKLNMLSGGEQQRVAIAIALANEPRLLLADEPTGAVDSKTSDQILALFRKLNRELGLTIVIVTHDPDLARQVDRVVAIRDGKTASEMIRKSSVTEQLAALASSDDEAIVEQDSHEEFAVVDKVGRLQLPEQIIEQTGMKEKNKVKVSVEDGKIVLTPPSDAS